MSVMLKALKFCFKVRTFASDHSHNDIDLTKYFRANQNAVSPIPPAAFYTPVCTVPRAFVFNTYSIFYIFLTK